MEKLVGKSMSREALAQVLVLSSIFAMVGALAFDSLGIRSAGIGPVSFVLWSFLGITGLFLAWPHLRGSIPKGKGWGDLFGAARGLWPQDRRYEFTDRRGQGVRAGSDLRLAISIFSANVPTFVLDADQRIVDWNPAFKIVFGSIPGLKRGTHVSRWFKALDNFKKIPRRSESLFGEAILPITDRERVTFTSKEWGRMVFVKIMTPVVDRGSGRVLGWTVVLNINSVNKRVEFFESLYGAIAEDTKRRFYAACYDGILSRDSLRRDLIAAHAANLGSRRVILDLGARTGELTFRMAREGRTVTSVEEDAHLLQRVRDKTLVFGSRVRLVKQSVSQLTGLPKGRYEGATMLYTVNRLTDPSVTLKSVYEALKEGGVLTLSAMIAPYSIETILNGIRQELSDRGRFLALKDQFNHVAELERQFASATPYRYPTREELLAWVQAAGFTVEKTILKGAGPDQPKATILLVLKK